MSAQMMVPTKLHFNQPNPFGEYTQDRPELKHDEEVGGGDDLGGADEVLRAKLRKIISEALRVLDALPATMISRFYSLPFPADATSVLWIVKFDEHELAGEDAEIAWTVLKRFSPFVDYGVSIQGDTAPVPPLFRELSKAIWPSRKD